MKKNFKTPLMTVSMFAAENVVTNSSVDLLESKAYKNTMDKITGSGKLVEDASQVYIFTF